MQPLLNKTTTSKTKRNNEAPNKSSQQAFRETKKKQELSQSSMEKQITYGDTEIMLPKATEDYGMQYQKNQPTPMARKRLRLERRNKTQCKWNHLQPDLMRLVTNKLNYEEQICVRATCKNWNSIKQSSNDFIHDMPLSTIEIILMKIAHDRFKEFFNFLICWIKGQTKKTVKALLDHIPIQELYHWGHDMRRPNESMFTYFMAMAQQLELSEKGHMLFLLFKNMFDIYFLPEKREDAVNAIIIMITSPETKHAITGMIMALKKIGGQIYPDTIFDALSGAPICNAHLPNGDNHYQPDGYPVHPDQIDDYTCVKCKVALLMGCLSAYLIESIDYYLDLY
ncbi:hypothetical protein POM88_016303 [Heracleum sosnowskyi]|uniref:F-box domain-containing protein n=1 Tax=Heracleum sosnowskyi TaxID=360622 RepID=A0AAD8MSU4_9APIA|nr:hypothetical protein POM88_016303 [Heracleum sosnowskyi]